MVRFPSFYTLNYGLLICLLFSSYFSTQFFNLGLNLPLFDDHPEDIGEQDGPCYGEDDENIDEVGFDVCGACFNDADGDVVIFEYDGYGSEALTVVGESGGGFNGLFGEGGGPAVSGTVFESEFGYGTDIDQEGVAIAV